MGFHSGRDSQLIWISEWVDCSDKIINMNILLLGGSSLRNKEWIYKVRDALRDNFDILKVHEYSHWATDEEFTNLNKELKALTSETNTFGEYAIFAKSIGTIIALQGMDMNILHPTLCIFTGLPIKLIEREGLNVKDWLEASKMPILIIQNENDPQGSFDEVSKLLQDTHTANCKAVSLPGDTHGYDDLKKLKETIISFSEQYLKV